MEHYITTAQLPHYDFTFSLSFHGSDHNTAESQKQIPHDDTKTFRTILRDGSVLLNRGEGERKKLQLRLH